MKIDSNTILLLIAAFAAYKLFIEKKEKKYSSLPEPPVPHQTTQNSLLEWAKLIVSLTSMTADTIQKLWGPGGPFYNPVSKEPTLSQDQMSALLIAARSI